MTPLRFLTAGESHGPGLTAILEGLPAGIPIDPTRLNALLARRQKAFGAGGRMRIERDQARITSGVNQGRSTGSPIALHVENRDHANWSEKDIAPLSTPRPGHADLTGAVKYGHRDLRLSLERASARETAARVAVGAVCIEFLRTFDIELGSYVVAHGRSHVDAPLSAEAQIYRDRAAVALSNDVACPNADDTEAMRAEIRAATKAKDTLGGVFEVFALGLPPGLGSYAHWDRRLDGQVGKALLSIPAMKGVELGDAFANATKRGTQVHDAYLADDDGKICREHNRAGGLEGGISTGAPLVARVAMKPIATTLTPLPSVDLHAKIAATTTYERSDISALSRAGVIGEAMLAFVLANALLQKVGGDSLQEITPRMEALRRSHLDDLTLNGTPWRFGYPQ